MKYLLLTLLLVPFHAHARVHTILDKQSIKELQDIYKKYYPKEYAQYQLDKVTFNHIVKAKSKKYNVNPILIHAIIKTESSYKSSAKSKAGAVGLMQLMPGTAKRYGITDRKDPEQNIDAGVHYLKDLSNIFDKLELIIAAYNAGEQNVIDAGYQIPNFKETKNYVSKVLQLINK